MNTKTKSPVHVIPVSTLPYVPGHPDLEVVDVIASTKEHRFTSLQVGEALDGLRERATKLGADAVIGVQVTTSIDPRPHVFGTAIMVTVVGTAVRYVATTPNVS
jgi:hypothetical protein